jgi:hypothetical protein
VSSIERAKAELFDEPSGGRYPLVSLGFGLVLIAVTVGGMLRSARPPLEPRFALAGFAFVCMGLPERLPARRRALAGVLRACSVCWFLLFGGVTLGSAFSDAGSEAQTAVVVYAVLAFCCVFALWAALTVRGARRTG